MSKIIQGSLVTVIDSGETYDTYDELFDKIVKSNDIHTRHAYGALPADSEIYKVLATVNNPFNSKDTIALIHNNNEEAYLIGVVGLELI